MRILAVTTRSPYPLHDGRALRTYNLIRELAQVHEVHLVSFVQTPDDEAGIEHMRTLCPVVVAHRLHFDLRTLRLAGNALCEPFGRAPLVAVKYRSAAMRHTLRMLLNTHAYDVVHLDMLHLAEYAPLCAPVPVVLTEHNVESVILARRAATERRWWARRYLQYQHARLLRFETEACRTAARVVAVSDPDAELLEQATGRTDIACVPNGVDGRYFAPGDGPVEPATLVFVGAFTWFPNEDAIRYFVDEVLPLIKQQRPDVVLKLIGDSPDSEARRHIVADPAVQCLGRLDDIRPTVAAATVYVVPLRIGGGTRLKILDALAMRKAVVSTSIGCEGLPVTHQRDILIADTPDTFASAVLRLLSDAQSAAELGRNGRDLVLQRHDWRALAAQLMNVYASTLPAAPPVPSRRGQEGTA